MTRTTDHDAHCDAGRERRLVTLAQGGSASARDELLRLHHRHVAWMATRYRARGAPVEDLIQEGYLGMLRALEDFDVGRGVRLWTYARWWVRARITKLNQRHRCVMTPPATRSSRTIRAKLPRIRRRLAAHQPEGEVGSEEIAAELGVAPDEVERTLAALFHVELPYEDDVERPAVLGNDPSPEDVVAEAELGRRRKAALSSAVARLPGREREILTHRYLDDEPMTLRDIGRSMGISRERVRQIEARALRRMRETLQQDSGLAA